MSSKLIAAGVLGPGKPSLEEQLERSVEALEGGARFVRREDLPSEQELHSVHAQLSRLIREQREYGALEKHDASGLHLRVRS